MDNASGMFGRTLCTIYERNVFDGIIIIDKIIIIWFLSLFTFQCFSFELTERCSINNNYVRECKIQMFSSDDK